MTVLNNEMPVFTMSTTRNLEWAEVLERMYENEKYWDMDQDRVEELADDLNKETSEINDALNRLDQQGFIQRDVDDAKLKSRLTQRGFDLVDRRKKHEEQIITDRLLVIFTTVLTLGIFILTSLSLEELANPVVTVTYHAIFALIFVSLGLAFREKLD